MSADSPNHSQRELLSTMQNIVTPQPVTDRTILDSVTGFISDVVPTAGGEHFDSKDQIQWVKFENLDSDETASSFSPTSNDSSLPSSLIIVLGYTTGVQVWAVPANGEAVELFSWRHGSVKVLKILPAPYEVGALNKRDHFETKRPLIALVEVANHSSAAGSLNFYSLKSGEQVKQIKFKNPILDVLANKRSVVITFPERIAVFDAFTLEDKLSVTSCYLSPGVQQNPVALGPRWLGFAEKKLIASRKSSGGNEGEGVQSYTATVLHAAKSLGRGLRELGDAVASSLTGNQTNKLGTSPNSPQAGGAADAPQKGIVTILDLESQASQNADGSLHPESIVAHFIAHTEAIVWLQFGPCGMLLLTSDKRGHDFNLFRINPHPLGSCLAAVHHLYTLHRGDTSARVQDMCFSFDSRWVTVSTLRGTTHVFPITPYGGNIGVRTHTTPHVVNKMSRFHRSAGLTSEGRSNSPVSMFDSPIVSNHPFNNPRFAPFPHPTVINPLAQLRQPVYMQNIGPTTQRPGRQRLTSSSEDNIALRVTACIAPARAWIDSGSAHSTPRESALNKSAKPVESLFVMNCHGTLVQYDLEPHHASHVLKEKVCDDTPIELTVTAKAQWRLQRQPTTADRPLPLSHQSLMFLPSNVATMKRKSGGGNDDDWLSQVEITTHAGPHRRLWMGPQFTFKTYTTTNGTPMSLSDAQPLDLNRSKPVHMPITKANAVLIESSSASSSEQSLLDIFRKNCEEMGTAGEHQIKEDLADAMMESPGNRDAGGRCVLVSMKSRHQKPHRASPAPSPIAKMVNPLGTVVTVHSDEESEPAIPEDIVIYENCDETLFRPVVTSKTVSNCGVSKYANLMTQSLKGDTNVTVRVMDKNECVSATTNWEDPRMQDIRTNTKVIVEEAEVTDLMAEQQKVRTKKGGDRNKKASKKTKEVVECKKNISEFEESQYGLVNPLYDVLEECGRINSAKRPDVEVTTATFTLPKPAKSSKAMKDVPDFKPVSEPVVVDLPIVAALEEIEKELDNEVVSFTLPKRGPIKPRKKTAKIGDEEVNVRKSSNVLTSLQSVDEISFPALDDKLDIPGFPPLEENFFSLENLTKPDPYEDAQDCGLPLEPTEYEEELKDINRNLPYDALGSSDTVSTSEDNIGEDQDPTKKKGSLKKPRKPKTKLGVKIITKDDSPDRSSNKESTPERSFTEVTLPPPARSWSSIAASAKSVDPWSTSNTIDEALDMNYTSSKLLDIDTPEERNSDDAMTTNLSADLLDFHTDKRLESSNSSPDLLKLSDKSSDDEKVESGSSPVDTTESSDEGKTAGVVEDGVEIKSVGTVEAKSKPNPKRRIRKKKK